MKDLNLIMYHEAGIMNIKDFAQLKETLENEMEKYQLAVYSDVKTAESDKKELKKIQKRIDDKKKEVLDPYKDVEKQFKELVGIVKDAIKHIDEYIESQKKSREDEVKEYFEEICYPLGDYAAAVFASPVFWEKSWGLKSTSTKKWRDSVDEKVAQIAADLTVLSTLENRDTLKAVYIETLDMDRVMKFSQNTAILGDVQLAEDEDKVEGWQIIKVKGTARQIKMLHDQMDVLGISFEIVEDGMPKEQNELTYPDFDSFVAFDIETSGTYGAANGDKPSEIIEIGAVKVVNGQIVDRFDHLCNPGRKILPINTKITGITNEMVADKPSVDETIANFAQFIGDSILVGHNIKSSDLRYIQSAAHRAGVAIENPFFDTYLYAKKFEKEKGWDNVKLEYLSERFGIEQTEAHRAWCDAQANVGVYFKLKEL